MDKKDVELLFDTKYMKVFDLHHMPGMHYYDATRRDADNLVATKTDEEFMNMIPDAVSCIVVVELPDREPVLLLSYEYRYPTGQYLLGVPAGLIDPQDKLTANPVINAAKREISEETGLEVTAKDDIKIVNPLLFSTPGMTDESNAIVCCVLRRDNLDGLTQAGCESTELFDGFEFTTKDDAKKLIHDGRDKNGRFYSVYTWIALTYFVGDLWR